MLLDIFLGLKLCEKNVAITWKFGAHEHKFKNAVHTLVLIDTVHIFQRALCPSHSVSTIICTVRHKTAWWHCQLWMHQANKQIIFRKFTVFSFFLYRSFCKTGTLELCTRHLLGKVGQWTASDIMNMFEKLAVDRKNINILSTRWSIKGYVKASIGTSWEKILI